MLDLTKTTLKLEPSSHATLHLLILEDVVPDIEAMVITLEESGVSFTYDTADTATDCQRLLQEQTYDAVLSDFQLPGLSGLQVFQLVQASGQEIPFILITGGLGEEAAVECIKAGMSDYVLKHRLSRLPTVLARSLQEFQLRHQQQAAIVQIQQQAQWEAITNQIVQAIHSKLVVEEVLQTTADLLHETLEVSRCLIFQPNTKRQMSAHYVSQASVNRKQLIGVPCGLFEHYQDTLSQGNQVSLGNLDPCRTESETPAPEIQAAASQFGASAFLLTPLVYQQAYLGGISLQQCDRDRQWTVEEMNLAKAIADQCAIAIHQARLLSHTKKQAQRERLLSQISQALNSSLDPQHILQEVVKCIGKGFGTDRAIIFSLKSQRIEVLDEWRVNQQVPSVRNFSAPLSDWPELLDPTSDFQSRRTFHAPDYAALSPIPNGQVMSYGQAAPTSPPQPQRVQQMQALSVLCAPILIRDQLFGGLALHTTTAQRTFTKNEIQLFERIASQTAIALDNAQSYEHLEQLAQERSEALKREKLLSEAASQAKSGFLANMSHELRTPLTSILGFSHVLLEQIFGPLNAKQQQYLANISSCGQNLLELINDLLDLSRVEADKENLNLEVLQVEDICQACLSLVQERANSQGLKLSVAIAANATTCIADKRRLKQVLFNLLSNSVKFTQSGSITLKVDKAKGIIQFSVIDTGIGISGMHQTHIFEPFVQLDNGLTGKHEGTGLGLALTRRLAQLHGGEVTVSSELGRGSCFMLRLPEQPLIKT